MNGQPKPGSGAVRAPLRSLNRWLAPYLRETPRRRAPGPGQEVHLLLCICDHFEPKRGQASPEVARGRVDRWLHDYPRLLGEFRDADGQPPRHSFFYPIDEYDPGLLDAIASFCREGFGEVEVHLHHGGETPSQLRDLLAEYSERVSTRHGVLPRDRSGAVRYGFIHGNWALDNSRPDGKYCGVNNELDILRETGCYADFTLPSAPSPTQTRTINRIYYAVDDPDRPKSHDTGVEVGTAPEPPGALMLIQGPLLLDWGRRKWGLLPRIENANLQGSQAPTARRLDLWLRARVQVPTRPDWFFVKLHTHGAAEWNWPALLGEPMVRFHHALALRARDDPRFHVHYVTARELYNLARAAEAGYDGTVAGARDFELTWEGRHPSARPATAERAPAH